MGCKILLVAVDRDDARAALGQQADGRGSDDAGSAGHDGNPAIEANSIGHFGGSSGSSGLSRILVGFAQGGTRTAATISFVAPGDQ